MLEGFRFSGRERVFQIGLDLRRLLAEDKGKLLMEHLFGGFPAAKLGGADGSAPGGELLLLVVDGLAELEQLSSIVRGKNLPVKARLLLDIRRNVRQLRKTGKLRQKRL